MKGADGDFPPPFYMLKNALHRRQDHFMSKKGNDACVCWMRVLNY